MSGWLWLIVLLSLSVGAALLFKIRGALLQLFTATLAIGSAGYALQGRPEQPGASASRTANAEPLPLTAARRAFFGDFTASERWLTISESYGRRGKTADAVGVLRAAIREHPGDAALWVGLGNALVEHARLLTPASELAFRRAAQLAPGHPAPPFFMGLALARSGQRDTAIALWLGILANAPADATWRPLVEDAVATLGGTARR